MTVTIHIWKSRYPSSPFISFFRDGNVGHVSMQINETYISHRPVENRNGVYLEEHVFQQTFINFINPLLLYRYFEDFLKLHIKQEDNKIKYVNSKPVDRDTSRYYTFQEEFRSRKNFGQKYDCSIVINGLNENVMLKYYQRLIGDNLKYHPIDNNCCTVVSNIIKSSLHCDCNQLCNFCDFKDINPRLSIEEKYEAIPFFTTPNCCVSLLYLCFIPILFLLHIFYVSRRVWTPNRIKNFVKKLEKQKISQKTCLKFKY